MTHTPKSSTGKQHKIYFTRTTHFCNIEP